MRVAALIEVILHMMGAKVPHPKTCADHYARAAAAAPAIIEARRAERSTIPPPLVAAVMGKEASWRWTRRGEVIRGEAGEVGWMQTKPDGQAARYCTDLDLLDRVENLRCALRLLELARSTCGGAPDRWLSAYNGLPCGPSRYADKVLAILARSRPALALNP